MRNILITEYIYIYFFYYYFLFSSYRLNSFDFIFDNIINFAFLLLLFYDYFESCMIHFLKSLFLKSIFNKFQY